MIRTTLRSWTQALEMYLFAVLQWERRDMGAAIARFMLYCMSKVFLVGLKLRRKLIDLRVLPDYTPHIQLTSKGNLTVGDTEKAWAVDRFKRDLQTQLLMSKLFGLKLRWLYRRRLP